jgi:hypothetical protein
MTLAFARLRELNFLGRGEPLPHWCVLGLRDGPHPQSPVTPRRPVPLEPRRNYTGALRRFSADQGEEFKGQQIKKGGRLLLANFREKFGRPAPEGIFFGLLQSFGATSAIARAARSTRGREAPRKRHQLLIGVKPRNGP